MRTTDLARSLTLPATLLFAGPAAAQDIVPLLEEGDSVSGVGLVTSIQNLTVNDDGSWIVEADTDNPDTNIDNVLVKDGVLYLQEGQALIAPAGATIDFFDTVDLNALGHSGWNFFLSGTSSTSDDSGVFYDSDLLIQEGTASTAPGFTPGTPYIGFFEAKINASPSILLLASVDDPAIPSSVDRALVVLDLDSSGALLSESIVVKEGDFLPGQTQQVDDMETGPHSFAYNEAGNAMFVANLAGDTTVDLAVYIDGTLLAQEGSPSPVAGRNWLSLSGAKVDLNDAGGWVISGSLDGDTASNLLIERTGAKFRQEGDTVDAIAPETITSFGSGPVQIADNGNVVWYAQFTGDTSMDTGLFLEDRLLVREGVTQIGGRTVTALTGVQDGYAMSPNGRYIVFEATLDDGTNGAYRIDLGPASLASRNGSGLNVPCYTSSDDPTLGEDWTSQLDTTGHTGASSTWIIAYDKPLSGVFTPFGEVLVAPEAAGGAFLGVDVVFMAGLSTHTVALPDDVTLAGLTAYTQGLILGGGPELCNAIDLTFGY